MLAISTIFYGWLSGDWMDAYHQDGSQVIMIQRYGSNSRISYGVLLSSAHFDKFFQWIVVEPRTQFLIEDDEVAA